jgi:hypothetical protein
MVLISLGIDSSKSAQDLGELATALSAVTKKMLT